MKTRNSALRIAALFLALALAGATTLAAAPPKDTLQVTAQTSYGSAGSVSPTVPGNAPNQWFYAFSLSAGGSLSQTFPVEFQLDNTNSTLGQSVMVSFNPVGFLGPFITVPASFSISDNSVPVTYNIVISTPALQPGDYVGNVQIRARPDVTMPHDTIHIQVHVNSDPTSCFLTDSDFNLLTDCSGTPVTGNSGGTFLIVGNSKGRVVATNPGQFYYNMIWSNFGGPQTLTINLSATGLNPQGANAVHALVFNPSGFVIDASNWDMVNQDGTPCGPTGPCTISVPAGHVLWVTWHLSYAGIGRPSAGISSSCPGNVSVSATGTLKDSFNATTVATCTASATGSLKVQ